MTAASLASTLRVGQTGLTQDECNLLATLFQQSRFSDKTCQFDPEALVSGKPAPALLFVNWDDMDALRQWNALAKTHPHVQAIAISEEEQEIRNVPCITRPVSQAGLEKALKRVYGHRAEATRPALLPELDVLVVDDSPSARQYLGILLEEIAKDMADITITYASHGKEALALAEEKAFDLVFLDIVMPDMDGYQVCEHLSATHKRARIALLTGKLSDMDREKGMLAGCHHYVAKPAKEEWLATILRLTLRHAQLREQAAELQCAAV